MKFILLFTFYLLTAKFGLSLNAVSGFATLVWLPTGIAFAALFLHGYQLWPAIALGAFAVNLWTGASPLVALGIASGNTLEALCGVYLFRQFVDEKTRLEKIREVLVLVIFVSGISTMISATIGVLSLYLGQGLRTALLWPTWRAWWVGDAISILVIAPLFLIWRTLPTINFSRRRAVELLVLGSSVILLCLFIFGPWPRREISQFIQPYWLFCLLIWTTLRFGPHANTVFAVVLSTIAVWGTICGFGPYQLPSLGENLLYLQLFISAVAMTGLFFGALGSEKEEALKIRNDFVSIASHELKTPITSLKLKIQMLKSSLVDLPLGKEEEIVTKIVDSSDQQLDRLTRLVDGLLDVSRIEEGKLRIERRETDLSLLVREVAENFREQFRKIGSELELQIEPSVIGNWDPYRLEQVVTNLLINAMKYGAGSPVGILLSRSDGKTRLTISDHGRGISQENHERIFERFERVDEKDNNHGLGLGLYISKRIIEAHKGEIFVESRRGEGARFTVLLPN